MRGGIGPGLALALFVLPFLGAPATASASDCGSSAECGVPECWDTDVRARPGMPRALALYCRGLSAAELVSAPLHAEITGVEAKYEHLRFTVRPEATAPRDDVAVFRLTGPEGSIEQRIRIEVIPTAENSAPVCYDDTKSQRTDGGGPVDLDMYVNCWDPDGDEMTVEGGGPGVHLDSPMAIPAETSGTGWRYRTGTSSGAENAPIWATDVLGARSADAYLRVTVGPDVDTLPWCSTNGGPGGEVMAVRSRAGAPRRFGLLCEDREGDAFSTSLSSPPQRGEMPVFLGSDTQTGWWGTQRWIDAVYLPADNSMEPDEFAVTASGTRGDASQRFAMTPVPHTENGGGGCGWSPANITTGLPGAIKVSCDDNEGDDLSIEVVGGPLHGTTGPGAGVPARYGWTDLVIPYEPDPGYRGYDCVKVVITDGHGARMELTVDVWVRDPVALGSPIPPVPDILPPTPLPELPPPQPPAPPAAPVPPAPASVDDPMLALAQHVFGTEDVTRTPGPGQSALWSPNRLSKRRLLGQGRAPGLLFVCGARCTVRTEARLATGARGRARPATRWTVLQAKAQEGRLVWLDVARGERRALKRARKPRATFKIRMRVRGAEPSSIERSLRIGR